MKKTIAMLLVLLLAAAGVLGSVSPSFASAKTLEVTSNALHYRSSPWGTVRGTVTRGQTFTILGTRIDTSSNTWYQIDKGWVHGDYVVLSGGATPETPIGKVSVTTAVLNVRSAPWGTWTGEVRRGAELDYFATRKDSSGDTWYQIAQGWVHGDYVKEVKTSTPAPAPKTEVTQNSVGTVDTSLLNVRSSVWGTIVGQVRNGAKFELLDSRKDSSGDSWYQIKYSGSSLGWVHGDYLKISAPAKPQADPAPQPKPAPAPAPKPDTSEKNYGVVTSTSLNVRDSVWGRQIGQVARGTRHELLDSSRDRHGDVWYQIQHGSVKGWVHGLYLDADIQIVHGSDKNMGMVNTANLNVRSDAWGNVISQVPYGRLYEITGSKKDSSGDTWYQILYSGNSRGWVFGEYLITKEDVQKLINSRPENDGTAASYATVQEAVWNDLIERGYSPQAAAGVMGNIEAESSFRQTTIESSATNAGEGIGLIQWSFSRKTQLISFAELMGKHWSDLEAQLAFLDFEINGSQGNVFRGGADGFKKMTSVDQATNAFCWQYLRPHVNYAQYSRRVNAAHKYYNQFK